MTPRLRTAYLEPTRTLRSSSKRPQTTGSGPSLEELLRTSSGRRLRCRNCGLVITSDGQRIEIGGRHVHHRINPEGFEFEFACFGEAPGAVTVGQPTSQHSWFAGYTWVYRLCGRCGAHLGWRFEGGDPPFDGLILNRLELEDEGQA